MDSFDASLADGHEEGIVPGAGLVGKVIEML
jgi:hypothetical protein